MDEGAAWIGTAEAAEEAARELEAFGGVCGDAAAAGPALACALAGEAAAPLLVPLCVSLFVLALLLLPFAALLFGIKLAPSFIAMECRAEAAS